MSDSTGKKEIGDLSGSLNLPRCIGPDPSDSFHPGFIVLANEEMIEMCDVGAVDHVGGCVALRDPIHKLNGILQRHTCSGWNFTFQISFSPALLHSYLWHDMQVNEGGYYWAVFACGRIPRSWNAQ